MKRREFWIRDVREILVFILTPIAIAIEGNMKDKRSPKIEDQKTDSSSGFSSVRLRKNHLYFEKFFMKHKGKEIVARREALEISKR